MCTFCVPSRGGPDKSVTAFARAKLDVCGAQRKPTRRTRFFQDPDDNRWPAGRYARPHEEYACSSQPEAVGEVRHSGRFGDLCRLRTRKAPPAPSLGELVHSANRVGQPRRAAHAAT